MANVVSHAGQHMVEGLEIFLRPITVLQRAGNRGENSLIMCAIALVVIAFIAEALALLNAQIPASQFTTVAFDWRAHIEPFVGMLLVAILSSVILLFGGRLLGANPTPARTLSVNTALLAAVAGGFMLAILAKGIVMVASPFDPIWLQQLVWLGPLASLVLGVLILGYSVIAARFGALVSWPAALLLAIIQFVVMILLTAAVDVALLSGDMATLGMLLSQFGTPRPM